MKLLLVLLALKAVKDRKPRNTKIIYGGPTKFVFTDPKTGATITVEKETGSKMGA